MTVVRIVCTGFGTMPSATALRGIPQISDFSAEAETLAATTLMGEGDIPGNSSPPALASTTALMANLFPGASAGLATPTKGVYVGEACPQCQPSSVREDYIDMGELLLEFRTPPCEDD